MLATVSFHLTPSSASNTTSFSALPILLLHLSYSFSSLSFSFCMARQSASSLATASLTLFTSAIFYASSACAVARTDCTSSYFFFLGSTFLITIWNFETDMHQIQRHFAASDFLPTSPGSNSGSAR